MDEIREVADYLRIRGDIPETTRKTIDEMLKKAKEIMPQRSVAYFDIEKTETGIKLLGTNIVLEGKLASKHFGDCSRIIIILATMTMESEIMLQRIFADNSEKGVVFDACLTQRIEAFLDKTEFSLFSVLRKPLTRRISCGYGDLNIEYQKDLLSLTDAKGLGVYQNECCMFTPNKTVIALVGIMNTK